MSNTPKVKRIQDSTQSFDKIGLFEVKNGDVVLRGRHGERDHVYPIDKAISRYNETQKMLFAMARHAIRGWDTLGDVVKDLRGKILEAVEQRRKLNRFIPKVALEFEQLHADTKVTGVQVPGMSEPKSDKQA